MRLTLLVDNTTIIDRYLLGEPGLCYLIEQGGERYLFDTGYSDVFIRNAQTLGLDLHGLDAVILSHGHNDHSWGLAHLVRHYAAARQPHPRKIRLVAHPDAFLPKHADGLDIGAGLPPDGHSEWFVKMECRTPYAVGDDLIFLGEIPRRNDFEGLAPIGRTLDANGRDSDDYVRDDSALVCRTLGGLVVISGCSHSGICNIVDYAIDVTGDERVVAVIGGFHLLNAKPEVLQRCGDFMRKRKVGRLYPCHCTDLRAKIALDRAVALDEIGVGQVLTFT